MHHHTNAAPPQTLEATLLHAIDQLATDIGRLQRRVPDNSSLAHLAERLAHHIETLDAIVYPTAHDLYIDFYDLEGALRTRDQRTQMLRSRLGLDQDGHRPTTLTQTLQAVA